MGACPRQAAAESRTVIGDGRHQLEVYDHNHFLTGRLVDRMAREVDDIIDFHAITGDLRVRRLAAHC